LKRDGHDALTTGGLLLLLGAVVYSVRETLSPGVAGLCVLIAFFCARRGIPAALATVLISVVLIVSWGIDGITAVLRPIGFGAVVAYLCAPLVRRLERPLRSRTGAILTVMVAILVGVGGIGVAFVPRLVSEIVGLIRQFPTYSAQMKAWYGDVLSWAMQMGVGERVEALRQRALEDLPGQTALEYLGGALVGFVTRAAVLLDLLVVPFVAFYLLKDGAHIGDAVARLLPLRHRGGIVGLLRQVDDVLGEYVRGQVIVCGIVAALTSAGLALCHIPYALLLGCMAGLLNVIPYVGLLTTFGTSAVVALFDPYPTSALLKVVGVFAVVQGLEGNLITPRIVGERVGLHPLWVILAMMVFSRMWGVLGMVAAVPVAAVLNVLLRVVADAYYRSAYYQREP
jgi:predicted PurR-regulated permease PerM